MPRATYESPPHAHRQLPGYRRGCAIESLFPISDGLRTRAVCCWQTARTCSQAGGVTRWRQTGSRSPPAAARCAGRPMPWPISVGAAVPCARRAPGGLGPFNSQRPLGVLSMVHLAGRPAGTVQSHHGGSARGGCGYVRVWLREGLAIYTIDKVPQ